MPPQIILYDLPSRPPRRCWSLNPWKTRMLLNYKQLDYQTAWVEYPDVEALIKPHLPPNAAGISYTIPTVQLPSGEWVMDSRTIAKRLEQLYPEPPLNIALDPYLAEIEDLADRTAQIVSPDFIPKIAKRVLGERSLGYWHRTREEWFMGQKLDKVAAEKGGPQVYREAAPLVARVTELLERNRAGPYFQGRIISYTDFIWASFLHFFEKLGGDSLEVLIGPNKESHLALLEACRPWLARYDH